MVFKKNLFIYILLSFIILALIIPTFSLAFDQDSVYVWSNLASSVSTSITPTEEEQESNSDSSNR